ncbi:MAG: hypothetical protein GX786_11025 [Clostridiales bacterium]|nr:hypothetical protein [Clostridiales bacterium]
MQSVKHHTPITPEEVIKLQKYGTLDELVTANHLAVGLLEAGHSCKQDVVFQLASCFRAGIIEGKRQERARRKRA